MTDDDYTIGTIISRDHDRDLERLGLMRLVSAFPDLPQVTIERVWNRVRQARNVQALARMRKGDSMAGLPIEIEWDLDGPWARSSFYYSVSRLR